MIPLWKPAALFYFFTRWLHVKQMSGVTPVGGFRKVNGAHWGGCDPPPALLRPTKVNGIPAALRDHTHTLVSLRSINLRPYATLDPATNSAIDSSVTPPPISAKRCLRNASHTPTSEYRLTLRLSHLPPQTAASNCRLSRCPAAHQFHNAVPHTENLECQTGSSASAPLPPLTGPSNAHSGVATAQ
jgi:hypothetical protein